MFKTIEECRCELVAHTKCFTRGGEEDGTYPADFLPVSAARASFGKEDKTGDNYKADLKLMKFLADNDHVTPFEYNHATFLIEAPLFVLSQIKTHRTLKALDLATNVISRRYTSEDIQFWIPTKWRKQSDSNKQASTDDEVTALGRTIYLTSKRGRSAPKDSGDGPWYDCSMSDSYEWTVMFAYDQYQCMIGSGVCREQARAVLPESLITRFYLGGTLRNWAGFIELRTSPNVQEETRVVANRICDQLKELWPDATNSLFANQE